MSGCKKRARQSDGVICVRDKEGRERIREIEDGR